MNETIFRLTLALLIGAAPGFVGTVSAQYVESFDSADTLANWTCVGCTATWVSADHEGSVGSGSVRIVADGSEQWEFYGAKNSFDCRESCEISAKFEVSEFSGAQLEFGVRYEKWDTSDSPVDRFEGYGHASSLLYSNEYPTDQWFQG
jgi:hypothetical protein